jgi:polyisoprenoid-binding protein YceI
MTPDTASLQQAKSQDRTATATLPAWAIDPHHSAVEFAIKHMMIATVTGRVHGLEGVLHLDPQAPGLARIEARAPTAGIDTGVKFRDDHLRSADFFDAANHPTLDFRSTRLTLTGPDTAEVVGELTLRGTTREVPFQVTFDGQGKDGEGRERVAFTAEARIRRQDWGLTWNQTLEAGGMLVGDQVKLTIRINAIRQP